MFQILNIIWTKDDPVCPHISINKSKLTAMRSGVGNIFLSKYSREAIDLKSRIINNRYLGYILTGHYNV